MEFRNININDKKFVFLKITILVLFSFILVGKCLAKSKDCPDYYYKEHKSRTPNPMLNYYKGSTVCMADVKMYDEYTFATGIIDKKTKKFPDKTVTGKITRQVFKAPPNRSILEIHENFRQTLKQQGFKVIYEAKGKQLWPQHSFNMVYLKHAEACLAGADRDIPPKYLVAEKNIAKDKSYYVVVFAGATIYSTCEKGSIYYMVDIIEPKGIESGLVKMGQKKAGPTSQKDQATLDREFFQNNFKQTLKTVKKIKLPELTTKQSLYNVRLISANGKYTYYQKSSGSLLLSKNFRVDTVLKGKKGAQYYLYSTPTRRKIAIAQDDFFHTVFSVRHLKNIFTVDYGDINATSLGKGISPTLHLNDTWISFYNPLTKLITFQSLEDNPLKFTLRLKNISNPYFTPNVVMLSKTDILITDLNKQGIPGIVQFSRKTKKSKVVYKAPSPNEKIEFCLSGNNFFIGKFGLNSNSKQSAIYKMTLDNISFNQLTPIYISNQHDIGNITCSSFSKDGLIFFIKNLTPASGKELYEVVSLDHKNNTIKTLSDVKYPTQIVNMDGMLLLPYLGKYYILKANENISKYDTLSDETND